MSKLSRTKGHSFEREIAIAIRPIFPNCRRHLEYQDGEANGIDLSNTGHYRIQCKRGRKPAPISAILEVEHDSMLGEVPVLVTRGDRGDCYVVLPFSEFKRLLAK